MVKKAFESTLPPKLSGEGAHCCLSQACNARHQTNFLGEPGEPRPSIQSSSACRTWVRPVKVEMRRWPVRAPPPCCCVTDAATVGLFALRHAAVAAMKQEGDAAPNVLRSPLVVVTQDHSVRRSAR